MACLEDSEVVMEVLPSLLLSASNVVHGALIISIARDNSSHHNSVLEEKNGIKSGFSKCQKAKLQKEDVSEKKIEYSKKKSITPVHVRSQTCIMQTIQANYHYYILHITTTVWDEVNGPYKNQYLDQMLLNMHR